MSFPLQNFVVRDFALLKEGPGQWMICVGTVSSKEQGRSRDAKGWKQPKAKYQMPATRGMYELRGTSQTVDRTHSSNETVSQFIIWRTAHWDGQQETDIVGTTIRLTTLVQADSHTS